MVERMNRILVYVVTGNNRQVLEPRNVKPKHKIQKGSSIVLSTLYRGFR